MPTKGTSAKPKYNLYREALVVRLFAFRMEGKGVTPNVSGVRKRKTGLGSKQHRIQAVELSQRSQTDVQMVSNIPAPRNGCPIFRF